MIKILLKDFYTKDEYQYQQYPLQVIRAFIEKGYNSQIIHNDLMKYVDNFEIKDESGKDYLIEKIFEITFIAIKIDYNNINDNIDDMLKIILKFMPLNTISRNLIDLQTDLQSLSQETKDIFKKKIKAILKENRELKSSELEFLLGQVSL